MIKLSHLSKPRVIRVDRRWRITTRVGIAFLATSLCLVSILYVSETVASLRPLQPLLWVVATACCSFAGLVSMRTVRTLRDIESELLRHAGADSAATVKEVALTPRHIIAADPICDGWNRLLDLAYANAQAPPRVAAALDHEAVTLARAMRGLPVAWVITDSDARVRYISQVATAILGAQDDTACEGRDLTQLLGILDDGDEAENNDLNEVLGPVRMVTLRRELTVSGVLIKLRVVRTRLGGRSGDGAGMAWVLQDITQQQLATEARDQFLMTATHEFRTPLNNLQAYAEAIVKQDGLDLERQKEFCNTIYTEANRLARLVDHLLTVSQMEAGSMVVHRHELDLLPILEQLVEHNQTPAAQKQITLTSQFPAKLPTVVGDRDKLHAALVNLIGNAIKYTPNGGEVAVSTIVEDEWIRIDFTDTGVGIPLDEQSRVFDKFFRGEQAIASTEPGNGIGLAFSREIARLHEGELSLRSAVGTGSTFTMRLPIGGKSRSGI